MSMFAPHFRGRVDLPEKKYHLESGLNQRDRATAGFGRDRSHGKPSIFSTAGAFKRPKAPLGFRFILEGACYLHGVGGFVFHSALPRGWLWAGVSKPRAFVFNANITQNKLTAKKRPGAWRPHPRPCFWFSPRWGVTWGETRISLGLVDLSRTPSGFFFREVHPGSEMASQNDQNMAK